MKDTTKLLQKQYLGFRLKIYFHLTFSDFIMPLMPMCMR